jgi:hypothetical protein
LQQHLQHRPKKFNPPGRFWAVQITIEDFFFPFSEFFQIFSPKFLNFEFLHRSKMFFLKSGSVGERGFKNDQ